MTWIGYAITALVGADAAVQCRLKLARPEGVLDEFTRLGWPAEALASLLGVVEADLRDSVCISTDGGARRDFADWLPGRRNGHARTD